MSDLFASPGDTLARHLDGSVLRRQLSLGLLVAVNLLPLLGVVAWSWDAGAIVVLYWSENLILGTYTIVKMLAISPVGGLFAGAFFVVHYGGFCAVHGLFVMALMLDVEPRFPEGDSWPLFLVFVQLLLGVVRQVLEYAPSEWLLAFAALFASHGVSLALNYFGGGEYRHASVQSLMQAPYKRIVVLHVSVIAGGFGVMAFGEPVALLIALVLLKLGVDVWLHLRSHSVREAAPA